MAIRHRIDPPFQVTQFANKIFILRQFLPFVYPLLNNVYGVLYIHQLIPQGFLQLVGIGKVCQRIMNRDFRSQQRHVLSMFIRFLFFDVFLVLVEGAQRLQPLLSVFHSA
ncbi:hypothetical protein MB84_21920 [Pandoraea oxalativorans]|uniref:Uncharacterized protein n=1 Tax=Pandoraea oxalativorans TaxID=573737 RepID=A0A0E3YG54_9BURK|nr:hypothetical protein MB84_21920 [Pandoraea oxalativorans]